MKFNISVIICLLIAINIKAQCSSECQTDGEATTCCSSESWTSHRPDGNAPIGVMADHYHHKGGIMMSYRFMAMSMSGNLQGSKSIDDMAIFQDYSRAPQTMNMQMHMFGLMYAPANRLTLTAMVNYLENEMSMLEIDDSKHFHNSQGLGDLKLGAIAGIWKANRQSIHLNVGLSIPTGDIDQSQMHQHVDHEMLMNLPYPMQLGSGTWDVFLGATYLAQTDKLSFGLQAKETLRTSENSNRYRLGNQYDLTSWFGYKINNWVSVSVRGEGTIIKELNGRDKNMMTEMSPTANRVNYGGKYINGYAGLNFRVPEGSFSGMVIGLEFGTPLFQSWNGIQMKRTEMLTAGLKYSLF